MIGGSACTKVEPHALVEPCHAALASQGGCDSGLELGFVFVGTGSQAGLEPPESCPRSGTRWWLRNRDAGAPGVHRKFRHHAARVREPPEVIWIEVRRKCRPGGHAHIRSKTYAN